MPCSGLGTKGREQREQRAARAGDVDPQCRVAAANLGQIGLDQLVDKDLEGLGVVGVRDQFDRVGLQSNTHTHPAGLSDAAVGMASRYGGRIGGRD